jgi:GNAT superfamily N-acetyltransferase
MKHSALHEHGGMASALHPYDHDPRLAIEPRPYDHPDARRLLDELYLEQIGRYGFADAPDEDPTEFAPPTGLFLVAYAGDLPCACGGLRTYQPGIAEIKKMYVHPSHRDKGLGRRILSTLEDAARSNGARRIILETGSRNIEALTLYERAGYRTIPPYRDRDTAINRALAKELTPFPGTDPC